MKHRSYIVKIIFLIFVDNMKHKFWGLIKHDSILTNREACGGSNNYSVFFTKSPKGSDYPYFIPSELSFSSETDSLDTLFYTFLCISKNAT